MAGQNELVFKKVVIAQGKDYERTFTVGQGKGREWRKRFRPLTLKMFEIADMQDSQGVNVGALAKVLLDDEFDKNLVLVLDIGSSSKNKKEAKEDLQWLEESPVTDMELFNGFFEALQFKLGMENDPEVDEALKK